MLIFVFFLPCLFGFQKSDSIKTITRPYLGVYACEKLVFGGIDYTKHAQDLKIELCSNGKLVATAKDAAGKIRKETAAYSVDEKTGEISLQNLPLAPSAESHATYQNDKIYFTARCGEKMLFAIFSR